MKYFYKLDLNNLDKRFNAYEKQTIGIIDYDVYIYTTQKVDFAKEIKEQNLPAKIKENLKALQEAIKQDEQRETLYDLLAYKKALMSNIQEALILGNSAILNELRSELKEVEGELITFKNEKGQSNDEV